MMRLHGLAVLVVAIGCGSLPGAADPEPDPDIFHPSSVWVGGLVLSREDGHPFVGAKVEVSARCEGAAFDCPAVATFSTDENGAVPTTTVSFEAPLAELVLLVR